MPLGPHGLLFTAHPGRFPGCVPQPSPLCKPGLVSVNLLAQSPCWWVTSRRAATPKVTGAELSGSTASNSPKAALTQLGAVRPWLSATQIALSSSSSTPHAASDTQTIFGGQWSSGWVNTTAANQSVRLKINILEDNTYEIGEWKRAVMPLPRVSGSAVLLPNGQVLLINGAKCLYVLQARVTGSAQHRHDEENTLLLQTETSPPPTRNTAIFTITAPSTEFTIAASTFSNTCVIPPTYRPVLLHLCVQAGAIFHPATGRVITRASPNSVDLVAQEASRIDPSSISLWDIEVLNKQEALHAVHLVGAAIYCWNVYWNLMTSGAKPRWKVRPSKDSVLPRNRIILYVCLNGPTGREGNVFLNSQWRIIQSCSPDQVYLVSRSSGKCLGVDVGAAVGSSAAALPLQQWDCDWSANQRFVISSAPGNATYVTSAPTQFNCVPPSSPSPPRPPSLPSPPPPPTFCQQIPGYTSTPDSDHGGDDLGYYGKNAPAACNSNPNCVAFNSYGLIKSGSTPLRSSAGSCFYVKVPPVCREYLGFTAIADVDHEGDNMDSVSPYYWWYCLVDAGCAAFNSDGVRKSKSLPLRSAVGSCLYVKTSAQCKAYAGFYAFPGKDRLVRQHTGIDVAHYDGNPDAAYAYCKMTDSCKSFNSYGWAKSSGMPITPHDDGMCLYVKSSTFISKGACADGKLGQSFQSVPGSLSSALNRLINDYCFGYTGRACDEIDFTGESSWYKEQFSNLPPLSNRTCNTNLMLRTAPGPPKASQRSTFTCSPNPISDGVCTLAAKLDTSSSATVTQGTGFNMKFSGGLVTKVSVGSVEHTTETTVDYTESVSEQTSNARIIGQAMGATVSVSTKPGDRQCYVLNVAMGRAATVGTFDVNLEFDGGVGTRQGNVYYVLLSDIVNYAKSKGWPSAAGFEVFGSTVRVTKPITINMDVPVYSYVNPQQYDLDNRLCSSSTMSLAQTSNPNPVRLLAADHAIDTADDDTTSMMMSTSVMRESDSDPLDSSSTLNITAWGHQSATRTLLDSQGTSSLKSTVPAELMKRLEALAQAYCKAQTRRDSCEGDYCDEDSCEVDWDGTTDWWRTFFITLPRAEFSTGLDAPVWNWTASTLQNQTSALVVCPYRPFSYRCQIDAQSYQSSVITRARTTSNSWGMSHKETLTSGFKIESLGIEGRAGITFSFSLSWSWSQGTATGRTETATTVNAASVQMNPVTNPTQKCAHLRTDMKVANVVGTQMAWMTIQGFVGFHHGDSRVWKLWIDSSPHYYRAQEFSSLINDAKSLGVEEADDWTIEGGLARIQVPIDLAVLTGASGSSSAVYYDAGSPECNMPEPV
ncbi:hypothetical protein VOLCADRAFT_105842 [Volvox carteri f. nagariensis]|uniref:Ricin B lectin domain-containing protein n=1 Tax=Volvox carteri f. nagariensis TaxID=3068 RepID=D8U3I7_VOLCA|nr:uncharacterized protein VOLCADRAFT_105842 [Volvox carteri f. nagariensis]EFJ45763.1 hypothetical protein VOLCADRAFT_105842 [Volvox carteri f. nagariensis]|eukprot:XP_002953164.1 hypothetical protein VOLCADRAFT_105842 [Volvox carteri f. nagariensis]